MQPGSGESHIFFPDNLQDALTVEVQDWTGKYYDRVVAQVATISDVKGDTLSWWSIYREPEHELVGKVQLSINYSTALDESYHLKCRPIAEIVAHEVVLEVAMKSQCFGQRNLLWVAR